MQDALLYGTPKVGGDILDSCSRCKMELAHVIVAMVGGKPARVQCKTCKSLHNYRLGKRVTTRGKTVTPKPRATRTTVLAHEYWEEQMKKNSSTAINYSPATSFAKGNVVQHPNFGLGIVEEVKRGGKIVVLFRTGDKVLVHKG